MTIKKHLFKGFTFILVYFFVLSCSKDDSKSLEQLTAEDFIININELPLSDNDFIGTIESNLEADFIIISQNPAGALIIDNKTGALAVANAELFDFEINPIIQATVEANTLNDSAEANVTINLNNIDEIEFYLSDSKDDYINAENGDWVIVTSEEYAVLATKLNNVTKSGFIDNDVNDFITLSAITPTSEGIIVANDNGATIPMNSYCFAFKYTTGSTYIEGARVKISNTSVESGYTTLGSDIPLHNEAIFPINNGIHSFVLKGNTITTPSISYLAFYSLSFIGYKTSSEPTTYYTNYGDVSELNTLGTVPSRVFVYQGLSTTQKQWD